MIKEQYQITYDQQGMLVSGSWYGYVIFCLVGTFAIERFGVKFALLAGYLFIIAGCVATMFAKAFGLVLVSLMVIWMGFGFFEIGGNALASQVFNENAAVYMCLMHFSYGGGSLVLRIVCMYCDSI